jgi:hypothetical protein
VPADLIHEIVLGVLHDQASGAALSHLGDEVCVRLDRLQRAWTTVQEGPAGDSHEPSPHGAPAPQANSDPSLSH